MGPCALQKGAVLCLLLDLELGGPAQGFLFHVAFVTRLGASGLSPPTEGSSACFPVLLLWDGRGDK